jgi:hypothetical protein
MSAATKKRHDVRDAVHDGHLVAAGEQKSAYETVFVDDGGSRISTL